MSILIYLLPDSPVPHVCLRFRLLFSLILNNRTHTKLQEVKTINNDTTTRIRAVIQKSFYYFSHIHDFDINFIIEHRAEYLYAASRRHAGLRWILWVKNDAQMVLNIYTYRGYIVADQLLNAKPNVYAQIQCT